MYVILSGTFLINLFYALQYLYMPSADLAPAHPDLAAKLRRVDLMRYGHAMSMPLPGVRSSAALRALASPQRRVQFAHADLSAYSVFEEALFHGVRAGRVAAKS